MDVALGLRIMMLKIIRERPNQELFTEEHHRYTLIKLRNQCFQRLGNTIKLTDLLSPIK